MLKYLLLLKAFFRASLIADLEYRMNIVVKVITDILWYVAQLSIFEVLFRHTNSISGWTLESTRVFMCVLFVGDSIWMLLFQENLDRFSDKIRRGDLDLLLAKPINSQFMLSFQRMNSAYIVNIFITVGMLLFALSGTPGGIHWARMPLLFILIPCSLAITYGIRFLFSASALIFTRSENINYIWFQFYRLGMRPDAIYPPWLRYIVLTIIPVGFIASVPSRIILHEPDPLMIASAIGLAFCSVYISTRFWKYALTFYSSASS